MKHLDTQSGRAESLGATDWIWEGAFSQPSDIEVPELMNPLSLASANLAWTCVACVCGCCKPPSL